MTSFPVREEEPKQLTPKKRKATPKSKSPASKENEAPHDRMMTSDDEFSSHDYVHSPVPEQRVLPLGTQAVMTPLSPIVHLMHLLREQPQWLQTVARVLLCLPEDALALEPPAPPPRNVHNNHQLAS